MLHGYSFMVWFVMFPPSYHLPKCQLSLPVLSTIATSSFDMSTLQSLNKTPVHTISLYQWTSDCLLGWSRSNSEHLDDFNHCPCKCSSLSSEISLSALPSYPQIQHSSGSLCCVASPRSDAYSGETNFVALHVASEANITRHNRWHWRGLFKYPMIRFGKLY